MVHELKNEKGAETGMPSFNSDDARFWITMIGLTNISTSHLDELKYCLQYGKSMFELATYVSSEKLFHIQGKCAGITCPHWSCDKYRSLVVAGSILGTNRTYKENVPVSHLHTGHVTGTVP
ncbi:hypothetical protein TSUD_366250 [Trifolium subterraneum]|uniref:Uncharacterized protein n=1 Tax=Trifolium subterraneum TaxID=3900 RepID=A0A2Z6PRH3_TRISU|nr:hypothetical protein TSUD_366250 [Trifolium subterraneum]